MVAERIKHLREQNKWTQADLAKKLSITRSSVNSWEMGLSVPSTQYVVELAHLFKISTDYILDVKSTSALDISGLSEKDTQIVYALIQHLRDLNSSLNIE